MDHSKSSPAQEQAIPALPEVAFEVARAVAAEGGRLWLVGGTVRDALLGVKGNDLDFEAHGLDDAALSAALARVGRAQRVGKSFGVYKLRRRGLELEISLPRRDSSPDAPPARPGEISLEDAARRRDLSVNAIAYDLLEGRWVDPTGGRADLAAGLLREADPRTFLDDPLRALRVLQLAARLGFRLAPSLEALCRAAPLDGVPVERVVGELEKLLLKAARPSVGLALGRSLGLFAKVLPELDALPAEPTDAAVDRAVRFRQGPAARRLMVMLAALLHRAPAPLAAALLDRLRIRVREGLPVRDRVLEALASWPRLTEPVSDAGLRALAEGAEVRLAAITAWAATGSPLPEAALRRAEALGVSDTPLPPLLYGRDLLNLGLKPGPALGRVLSQVRQAQIQGTVSDPEGALALARLHLAEAPPLSSG